MDIRTFDLNLLRTLDALLDARSVTRAAARLGLTQPAVSGALARLREALGDPLFVRTQRGVLPTPRALELAGPVKRLLSDAEALVRPTTFDPATLRMTLSITASDYAQRVIVAPFFAGLREAAPGVRLALRAPDPAQIPALLEQGEAHLAILSPEQAAPSLYSRHLFDDRYVLAMGADHPAAGEGTLGLERFLALEHAMVSQAGGGFRGPLDIALERLGRRREVVASAPGFVALLDLLHRTHLVAAAPERLVRGEPGLHVGELPVEAPGFSMIAAWHARTHEDPAHRWLRGRLAESVR